MSPKTKKIVTIAVTSGKGGVGKTNIVTAIGLAMREMNKKVLILDADLGLGNIDVLLNITPKYTLKDVLDGNKHLKEIIVEGPKGIKILPASSGIQELTQLDEFQRLHILDEFERLEQDFDILLIDTGAGISNNVAFFCMAAREIVVVTTPEPTAITDAYALIKVLFTRYQEKEFKILVNYVTNEKEAIEVYKRISTVADRFLQISLDYLGYIPKDDMITKAVKSQKSFFEIYPDSEASRNINAVAKKIIEEAKKDIKGTIQFFFGRLNYMGNNG